MISTGINIQITKCITLLKYSNMIAGNMGGDWEQNVSLCDTKLEYR